MNKFRGVTTKEKKGNFQQMRHDVTAATAISSKAEAHIITLHFIENEVTVDFFKDKIRYISPEQYVDVVIERALNKICGYPLCNMMLTPQYGSQTYIIRHNKLYDITMRKNFCSDTCYEASCIIENQVPKIPLYLRKDDKEIANLKLCIPDTAKLHGRYGKLVNIRGIAEYEEDNATASCKTSPENNVDNNRDLNLEKKLQRNENIETGRFPLSNDTDISNCAQLSEKEHKLSNCDEDKNLSCKLENVQDRELGLDSDVNNMCPLRSKNSKKKPCKISSSGKLYEDLKIKSQNKNLELLNCSKLIELIQEVEQKMRQWMTFESLKIILGDKYVRGMLEELGKTWEDYDSTSGLRLGMEGKSRYISLCKKLDYAETEEEIFDSIVKSSDDGNNSLRPMPDFNQLKKDVDMQAIKVRAFFEGKEEFATNLEENSLETIKEEEINEEKKSGDQKTKTNCRKSVKTKQKHKIDDDQNVDSITLPLIDSYTQNTWRRQIVLEKISKPISYLTCEFGLDEGRIRTLLKPLVASFDLTAHNIVFRVGQWEFVALVLLKMLCVRYPVIHDAMNSKKESNIICSLLMKAELDNSYLDRLLSYLTEIIYVLGKYHNSNSNKNYISSNSDSGNGDTTMIVNSSSLDNQKSEFLGASEKLNNSLTSSSPVVSEDLLNRLSEDSFSPEEVQNKTMISDERNSNCDNMFQLKCDNKVSTKDYTDIRELVAKTDNLNIENQNISTNYEELD